MLLLKDIKGQNNAVKYLSNCLSAGRVANSYLFTGPEGVGRASSAKAFIAELVCSEKGGACGHCAVCRKLDALEHPDVLWIKPVKNSTIKIDEIREARELLNLKPFEAQVSVCVIEDAHMMTVEASNALLKVLEEPPGKSLIILITSKKELLLETVISRCAEVRFHALPFESAREVICKNVQDLKTEEADFLAYFSQGSPGRAMRMIEEGVSERKEEIIALIETIAGGKDPVYFNWDDENKDQLLEDLEMLVVLFRDIALEREGLREMVLDKEIIGSSVSGAYEKYSAVEIYSIIERLIKLKMDLARSINTKLAAQVLPGFLKIDTIGA